MFFGATSVSLFFSFAVEKFYLLNLYISTNLQRQLSKKDTGKKKLSRFVSGQKNLPVI